MKGGSEHFRLLPAISGAGALEQGSAALLTLPSSSSRHSSALRQLLTMMMTVDPQQRPHIPFLLSQLEALQPPAQGQHTTQI